MSEIYFDFIPYPSPSFWALGFCGQPGTAGAAAEAAGEFKNRKTQVAANKEPMRLAIVKGQHSFLGGFHFSFFHIIPTQRAVGQKCLT